MFFDRLVPRDYNIIIEDDRDTEERGRGGPDYLKQSHSRRTRIFLPTGFFLSNSYCSFLINNFLLYRKISFDDKRF